MDHQFQQEPSAPDARPHEDDTMTGVEESPSVTPNTQPAESFHSSNGTFSPIPDATTFQQQVNQPGQPYSRPSSGLSSSGHHGYASNHQDQRGVQQDGRSQNSVVVKVGMVGDAQIGKTSLMVKYVEGSWDEDYIQTLGQALSDALRRLAIAHEEMQS